MAMTIGIALVACGLFAATMATAQTVQGQAPTTLQDSAGDNLSSKLSHSGGVITPKSDVDPGIGKAAPEPRPNSTPVIPPSATGGGSAR